VLEKKAPRYLNKHQSQDSKDKDLIAKVIADSACSDDAYSVLDNNNNEQTEIQQ
jgi:hypothetical protein